MISDDLLQQLYREATIVRGKGEAFAAMRAVLEDPIMRMLWPPSTLHTVAYWTFEPENEAPSETEQK